MTANNEPNAGPDTGPGREPISELVRMRRDAHAFLNGDALVWFAQRETFIGPMRMPPSLPAAAGAEPMERLLALAADEAKRLEHAALFSLDPGGAAAAVSYGARLQTSAAMDAAAGDATIATHGIVPPVPAGFLRWATPITDPDDPMPVIGVHWGRITTSEVSGTWLAFWVDLRGVLVRGLADVSAPDWLTPQLATDALAGQSSVYYEEAAFLQDPSTVQEPGADPSRTVFAFPHLRCTPLTPPPADQLTPEHRLIYIVLASWAILTPNPDQCQPPHLTQRAVPAREIEADRRAGLPPARRVTLATAPILRTTDPLPEGVDDGIRQLSMSIVAIGDPDAPDGPDPDQVIADLLSRYEPEVLMMAAYQDSRHLLEVLAKETQISAPRALAQILSHFPDEREMPFDNRAWPALRHLLRAQRAEPTLPPPGITPADLLWALGTFQACALIHITGNRDHSNRRKRKPATRPSTKRARKKRR